MKNKILLFLLIFYGSLSAQLEENIWFLGGVDDIVDVGIRFSGANNDPQAYNDIRFPFNIQENNIIISDGISGDVQFYSDGQLVIDGSHNPMPNGLNLFGTSSTMYGTSVVYDPAGCRRYYLFYGEDETTDPPRQIYYSIIDLDLPGNGTTLVPLGDVVSGQKNIPLLGATINASEGLYAIPKSSTSKESWLFVGERDGNNLFIYDVNSSGVELHGTYYLPDLFPVYPTNDELFGIRLLFYEDSPIDGRLVLSPGRAVDTGSYPIGFVNFNLLTGVITDAQATIMASDVKWAYGLAFSSDGTKFYFSDYIKKSLTQFDFNNSDLSIIGVSSHSGRSGGLKLAPNGKIYWANRYNNSNQSLINSMAAINNPNAAGLACNLEYDAYFFNGNPNPRLLGALPTFGSFPARPNIVSSQPASCGLADGSAGIISNSGTAPFSYLWDNGETTQIALSLTAGQHLVSITDAVGCLSIGQVEIAEAQILNTSDLTINPTPIGNCLDINDGSLEISHPVFLPNSIYMISYQFDGALIGPVAIATNGQGELIIENLGSGVYLNITISDENDCSVVFPETVLIESAAEVLAPIIQSNGSPCFGDSLTLFVNNIDPEASYEWQSPDGTILTGTSLTLGPLSEAQNGIYLIQAVKEDCESQHGEIEITIDNTMFDLGPDITICGLSTDLVLPTNLIDIQWNTGSQLNTIEITSDGWYSFMANSTNGCLIEDSIFIDFAAVPELDLGNEIIIEECQSNTVVNTTIGENIFYQWNSPLGIDLSCSNCPAPSIAAEQNGWIYAEAYFDQVFCSVYDSIQVTVTPNFEVYIPNAFSPNFDGANEGFTLFAKNSATLIEKMEIYSRWGELVFEKNNFPVNNPALGWDGDFNAGFSNVEINPFNNGLYVYHITLLFVNGERRRFAGDVTLIR